MKTKVVWTTSARNELALIYQYLLDNTSVSIALNLIQDILDVSQLEQFPQSGAIESNLVKVIGEYRYLIRGRNNYKIIYRVEGDTVYIVDIFDCRKDPKQMKERIK
ncbi:type II toxin-antitoxin system RelE/ParE family toxin [Dysgonomonas termitidis]|uniref:Type II toxin-antitoxin system RelE/ParE family toxin n=1 Tax=Dysgonomonas termitidis TaxID=1516126 RepID=A0ABV9L1B0_9BACT